MLVGVVLLFGRRLRKYTMIQTIEAMAASANNTVTEAMMALLSVVLSVDESVGKNGKNCLCAVLDSLL